MEIKIPKEEVEQKPIEDILREHLDPTAKIFEATGVVKGKLVDFNHSKLLIRIGEMRYSCPSCYAGLDIEEARHLDAEGIPVYTCPYCNKHMHPQDDTITVQSYTVTTKGEEIVLKKENEQILPISYLPNFE